MKVIGAEMMGFFPNAQREEIMDEQQGLSYPYTVDDVSFDKQKKCFIINGGEVYAHTCPKNEHGNRPNCCEYCIYNSTARFYRRNANGMKFLVMTCKGLNMCKAFQRLNKAVLEGQSLFFRDSINFKTHETDKVTLVESTIKE